MDSFKTLQDVITFAISKEEAAYQLYSTTAQRVQSPAARKMLEEMASQELGHKRMMEAMTKEKLASYDFARVPDLKIGNYLQDVDVTEDMSFRDVLVFAMKSEEAAYQLYTAAENLSDDPEIKGVLRLMATEEKKHKYYLETMYDDKVLAEM